MKERRSKLKKLSVTAVVVAATMAMSATTAMAGWTGSDKNNKIIANSTEVDEAIVIGKSLKTPKNWSPENLSVTFSVVPVGFSTTKEGSEYQAVSGLSFDGTVTLTNNDFKVTDEKEQVKYWGAESENLVNNIKYTKDGAELKGLAALAAVAETQKSTGAVKFTVTETNCTYDNSDKTVLVKSEASYDLVFWIDYKVDEDGKSKYEVTSITDTKTKKDNGTATDQKVDPTSKSTDVEETGYDTNKKIEPVANTNLSYDLSGMLFNNDITKSDEPEDPDTPTLTDSAFKLSKKNVNGDENQEFQFTVNLTAPVLASVDTSKTIAVKVFDKDGKEVANKEKTFSYGTDNTISLKGGETAVFGQMYNSTKVEVTEAGTPNYVPSYASIYGSSTEVKNAGDSLKVTGVTKSKDDYVNYTNTYQSITPTGIIMNNLPFFMMIVIGAFAVVAGFVFQARRRVAGK